MQPNTRKRVDCIPEHSQIDANGHPEKPGYPRTHFLHCSEVCRESHCIELLTERKERDYLEDCDQYLFSLVTSFPNRPIMLSCFLRGNDLLLFYTYCYNSVETEGVAAAPGNL